MFSTGAVWLQIPTNSVRSFPFLHTLSSIYCLQIFFLNDGYSDQCGVILHCSFDLVPQHYSTSVIPGELPLLPAPAACCSVTQSCPTLYDPMDCSTPGFPFLHRLLEFAQTHVHWVGDAIQPSHLLLPTSPPAFNLSQHQGLFQWISSSHQVAQVLELQL